MVKVRRLLKLTPLPFLIIFASTALGQITEGAPQGGMSEWLGAGFGFLTEMLMIPVGGTPPDILIWIGGIGITIYAFKLGVENFDNALGGWLPRSSTTGSSGPRKKDLWIISILLTLLFVGGTNFMGWVTDMVWIIVIGVALFIIGLFIRVFWFGASFAGGSALWAGHQARTGSIGSATRAAADSAQAAFGSGGRIDSAYNSYKSLPTCPNNHLNPPSKSGGSCWRCGGTPT